MTSLWEVLENPRLRAKEIARLKAAAQQSRKDGYLLDAVAYESSMQLFTDAEEGIERCYSCGRMKNRRRGAVFSPPERGNE